MVPPWLASNPRARPTCQFGREQQFVIDPNGIPELLRHAEGLPRAQRRRRFMPCRRWPRRLGIGEIRVKDESQRFGFGAFKALGGVLAVYNVLSRRGRRRLPPSARPSPTS